MVQKDKHVNDLIICIITELSKIRKEIELLRGILNDSQNNKFEYYNAKIIDDILLEQLRDCDN